MTDMREPRPGWRILRCLLVSLLFLAACTGSGDDAQEASGSTTGSTDPTTTSEPPPEEPPAPIIDETETEAEPGAEDVDPACADFRELLAVSAPCEALVLADAEAVCARGTGEPIDCTSVPSDIRVESVAGAVVGAQPPSPDPEAMQYGGGAGQVNTTVLITTATPVPQPSGDQLELAVVFAGADAAECAAPGETWDGAAFVTVLRLGPAIFEGVRVTDLICRRGEFVEIGQRSTWVVTGNRVIAHLPLDLPGSPSAVTGSFRPAPDFAPKDGRTIARRLDPAAWAFDDPVK